MTSMVLSMKPLLLCMVCVERYMVVPHEYLRYKAHSNRWGCLSVAWCVFVLMASSSLGSTDTVCAVFLPALVVDTSCNLSVLRALRKPPPGDRKGAENRKTGGQVAVREVGRRANRDMNSMKRKAFITIVTIQAVLTLNYLPFIVCLPLDGVVPVRALTCQYLTVALATAAPALPAQTGPAAVHDIAWERLRRC
ncbi:putative disintegrin and metalloproteinase domain-containing protein 12-like [Scophthalmus maximus]|uniref:Putative disintegrin and metalloproteinase domain-containing protein 12-like n=1 Tax=Scophthalmus maximus TaxID=52904 RepID=A0A2U9BAI0_SCOMX|nr:putative disintegrin and metalloproteinase domain-containing protein 12-like [Scophthalmus maximus]